MRIRPEAGAVAQAAVLTALVAVPLFFNPRTERAFEPDKLAWVVLLGLVTLAALVAMALGGIGRAAAVRRSSLPSGLDAAVAAAAVLYAAGVFGSVARNLSVWGEYRRGQGLVAMIGLLTMYAAARYAGRQPGFAALARRATVLAVAGVAGYALLQRLGQDNVAYAVEEAPELRPFGPLGNPILLSAYLVMALPILGGWLVEAGHAARSRAARAGRVFAALAAVLAAGIAALALAQSRGPVLAFLAGLAVWAALALAGARRWRAAAVLAIGVSAGIAVLASGQVASESLGRLGDLAWGRSRTARERLIVWRTLDGVAGEAGARGLLGYGPDTTLLLVSGRLPEEQARLAPGVVFDDAHNAAWEWWVTGGYPGVAAWLALYVGAFTTGLGCLGLAADRRARARAAGIMALVALAAAWSARHVLGPGTWPVGLAPGLIVGLLVAAVWAAARPGRPGPWACEPSGGPAVGRSLFVPALMAALAGHLVESAVGVSGVASELLFWVCLGWLAAQRLPGSLEAPVADSGPGGARAAGPSDLDGPGRSRTGAPPAQRGSGSTSPPRRGSRAARAGPCAAPVGWSAVAAVDGIALATVAFAPLLVPGRPGAFGRPLLWLLPAALWLLADVLGAPSSDRPRGGRLERGRFGPDVPRLARLAPAVAVALITAAGDGAARGGTTGLGTASASVLGFAVVLLVAVWCLAAGLPAGGASWPRRPVGWMGAAAIAMLLAWVAWRTALAPVLADSHVRVGREAAAAGLVAEAGAHFDRALALWPEQTVLLAHVAAARQQQALSAATDSLAAREAFAEAEAALLEAERRVPSAEAARLLASLYRSRGDHASHPTERLDAWSSAESWFREGLGRAPHDAEMLMEGAMLRERFGDAGAAEDLYRRAADLRPDLPSAWLGLARSLVARGEAAEAGIEIERAAAAAGSETLVRLAREAAAEALAGPSARLVLVLALAVTGDRAGASATLAAVEAARSSPTMAAPVRAWLEGLPAAPPAVP